MPPSLTWVGIAVAIGVYLFHTVLFIRHVNDDAFITFRYSRFLASGLGPYFNVGEHVEGYTNFLHMLLMSAVYAVGGESAVPVAARALGILAGGASLVLLFLIVRRLVAEIPDLKRHAAVVGALAAGLVAVFPGYAMNSTSGLETTLFSALLALGLGLGLRAQISGRWCGSGIAWAAAAWTRPEGIAVFLVYWIAAFLAAQSREEGGSPGRIRLPRPLAADAIVFLAAVVAQLGFRVLAYDGEILPNTWFAKAAGFRGHTPWEYVRQGALAPFLGPVGVLAGLLAWYKEGRAFRLALPLLAVALFGATLPFLVGADWMPGWRFAVPYLPFLAAAVGIGWFRWLRPILARAPILAPILALVVVAGLAALHHGERRQLASLVDSRADGYATGHRALAEWIRTEAAEPGDTVAMMDIGIVGYYCHRQRILDITGLTDRYIAKSPGRLLEKRYDPSYVLDQKPEFIVLVLSALGDGRKPLPDDATIGTWIKIEAQILAHPEFQAHYVRKEPGETGSNHWIDRFAARFGAERVFEHAHPDQYYLMAVFRRQES